MASVTFASVTKRFDQFIAVNNLNITIADQEFLVFVGPSGCGKTTSLRMLAGLEDVTMGNLYINDKGVNQVPPKDRDIAMVFQSYALYPHLSVYENMAFSLELQGKRPREIRARVEKAAKQMGIENLLDRKPKQLSGGQRQRVAVGRAIVRDPAVFLMDEPLSNLDAKLRVQARSEIIKLHQELGTTFIYVTHDQVEAMTMGTRIAVMNGGILQQVDTPQNLYNRPQNQFVAGFMGSPAMNFVDAVLIEKEGKLWMTTPGFEFVIPEPCQSLYQSYQNQPVIFGIRPENIHDPAYLPPKITPAPVKVTVSMIELMGHEIIVYLTTANQVELVGRVDKRSQMKVGETLEVMFDLDNFYLFDPQTQQTLGLI